MTENNGGVRQKKVMSKKESGVTTQGRKEEEVSTLLLGNDKNNVIINYLLTKLVFVLKLSALYGLKGYLKQRINKVWRKNKYKFSVRRC